MLKYLLCSPSANPIPHALLRDNHCQESTPSPSRIFETYFTSMCVSTSTASTGRVWMCTGPLWTVGTPGASSLVCEDKGIRSRHGAFTACKHFVFSSRPHSPKRRVLAYFHPRPQGPVVRLRSACVGSLAQSRDTNVKAGCELLEIRGDPASRLLESFYCAFWWKEQNITVMTSGSCC